MLITSLNHKSLRIASRDTSFHFLSYGATLYCINIGTVFVDLLRIASLIGNQAIKHRSPHISFVIFKYVIRCPILLVEGSLICHSMACLPSIKRPRSSNCIQIFLLKSLFSRVAEWRDLCNILFAPLSLPFLRWLRVSFGCCV